MEKPIAVLWVLVSLLQLGLSASQAVTRYVNPASRVPRPPYSSWEHAARTIQIGVDAADPGDLIIVTNGLYLIGGARSQDGEFNRVSIRKAVRVQSLNGAEVTRIDGQGKGRCVYLGDGAQLSGFTLTNGFVQNNGGGGAFSISTSAILSYCIIRGNVAQSGGGVYGGTLIRCQILENRATEEGGGILGGVLNSCVVAGNQAKWAGGAFAAILRQCNVIHNTATRWAGGVARSELDHSILYDNTLAQSSWRDENYDSFSVLNYSCTFPKPPAGIGNADLDPQLASHSHLSLDSPCRGAGANGSAEGSPRVADIDGEAWLIPRSIGSDEVHPEALVGDLKLNIRSSFTVVSRDFEVTLHGEIDGQPTQSSWNFGDGTMVTNRPSAKHRWSAAGDYTVVFKAYNTTHPDGVSVTNVMRVQDPIHYVSLSSTNPVRPYRTWETAATKIQDAIEVAGGVPGATVLVSNGVYRTGGRVARGILLNRVAAQRPVNIQSVHGPEVTVIQGNWVSGTTNGETATRCVYLGEGASLSGFTLVGGATSNTGDPEFEQCGGGVWCADDSCVVSDCIIQGNAAHFRGGGAYRGTLLNCRLQENSAETGGGASDSTLKRCHLRKNTATAGGGANSSFLEACFVGENTAREGGGIAECTATHSTITRNIAVYGGGINASTTQNSIVYYNQAEDQPTANFMPYSVLNFCCTTPLPTNGVGNLSEEPRLATESHLSQLSPCIGAGASRYASGTDLDGEAWASAPSIGCDEPYFGHLDGPLEITLMASDTDVSTGYEVSFTARISGQASLSRWDFGDGSGQTNQAYSAVHRWSAPGDYHVTLWAYSDRYPNGFARSILIRVTRTIHYVSVSSPSPAWPYATWATAATNIQDAVDAATRPGSTILVADGVYRHGVTGSEETGASRVTLARPLILRSLNGPGVTTIQGYRPPNLTNNHESVRCVTLLSKSEVIGFTLTEGSSLISGNPFSGAQKAQVGGGALCLTADGVLSDCVVRGNVADQGGGVYGGSLYSCVISSNSAGFGGGTSFSTVNRSKISGNTAYFGGGGAWGNVYQSQIEYNSATTGGGWFSGILASCSLTFNSANSGGGASGSLFYLNPYNDCILNQCTVSGNTAAVNGGVQSAQVNNCIVYGNFATHGEDNHDAKSAIQFSCTTPQPATGKGNITADPAFSAGFRVSILSPCRGAGNPSLTTDEDVDGERWLNPPSMGCDEYLGTPLIGPLRARIEASFTDVVPGFEIQLKGLLDGQVLFNRWDFGDGVTITNQLYPKKSWGTPGDYRVSLWAYNETHPDGIAATIGVHVAEQAHYVWVANPHPQPPFQSWETAANSIQDAVDVVVTAGATLWISNGVYRSSGRVTADSVTNQVSITKPLKLFSVHGPAVTIIDGGGNSRCLSLSHPNISIAGLTLTNGNVNGAGGGIQCESLRIGISNCLFVGNVAEFGGGSQGGTLTDCVLERNTATWYGGGANQAALNRCVVRLNVSEHSNAAGGGVAYSTLDNCILTANSAKSGGAAFLSTLRNCTVAGNFAFAVGGILGDLPTVDPPPLLSGETPQPAPYPENLSVVRNCIVYHNENGNWGWCDLRDSCTTPLPASGNGLIDLPPLFVDLEGGDFRLSSNSPCVNAGNNLRAAKGPDLAAQTRIIGGTVDLGAYEFQSPQSRISYAWLERFQLPADGTSDASDFDADGHTALQEWQAGTDPTNLESVLRLLLPEWTESGLLFRWRSVSGKSYRLESTGQLSASIEFTPVLTNIAASTDFTQVLVPLDRTTASPALYRIRVE